MPKRNNFTGSIFRSQYTLHLFVRYRNFLQQNALFQNTQKNLLPQSAMGNVYRNFIKNRLSTSFHQYDSGNILCFTIFMLLAALAALAELLFTLYKGFYISSFANCGFFIFSVATALIVYKKKKPVKLFYFLLLFNFGIAISLLLEGMAANGYIYYFSILTAVPLLANRNKLLKELALSFFFSTGFFCLLLVLLPYQSFLLKESTITDADYRHWFYFKLTLTLFISAANTFIAMSIYSRNEQALLNEKSYTDTVFNTSLSAYLIIHKDVITDYNQRTIALFQLNNAAGFKEISYTRWLYRHLVLNNPAAEKVLNENPCNWEGELNFVTLTGNTFCGHVTIMPFEYNEESYVKVSIMDISSLKNIENELRLSREKAENAAMSKTRFLSSMSHELRTPLNGIIGTANLLLHEKGLQPEVVSHIDVLKYSSEHMLGIINDILDFSKIEAGKMNLNNSSFNVKTYLNKVSKQFQPQFDQKQLTFTTTIDSGLDELNIRGDELKLGQVLNNLLSNALKYTNAGHIDMNAQIKQQHSKQVEILFQVTDTGIGIAPDKLNIIFDGFTQVYAASGTSNKGGTGLGLTISKKLVELFGSKLLVESEPDKGSRFFFTAVFDIDKTIRTPYVTANVHVRPDNMLRGLRVLLVEDNAINMKVAKSFLRKWNASIKEAGNGIEALELVKHHTFDIILMDLDMPDMDGYTATKILRKEGIGIPVLAFTAALVDDLEIKIQQAGFDGCILKPFKPNDLYAKIEACVKANVIFV